MSRKRQQPREVVRVISSNDLLLGPQRVPTLIGGGHIEVREHTDGKWSVHYPEEGFIPLNPSAQRPFTECGKRFSTYLEALDYGRLMADNREVKVIGLKRGRNS